MIREHNTSTDTAGGFFWGKDSKTTLGSRPTRGLSAFVPRPIISPKPLPADQHGRQFAKAVEKEKMQPSRYFLVLQTLIKSVRSELMTREHTALFVPPGLPINQRFYSSEVETEDPKYFKEFQRLRKKCQQNIESATLCFEGSEMLQDKFRKLATATEDQLDCSGYAFDRCPVWKPTRSCSQSFCNQGVHKYTSRSIPQRSRPTTNVNGGQQTRPKKWSKLQKLQAEQLRQRCEHVVKILERELSNEMERQLALYEAQPYRVNKLRWEMARERAESADSIMRVLHEYHFVSASTFASYLQDTIHPDTAAATDELRAIRDGRRIGYDKEGRAKDLLELVSDNVVYKEDKEGVRQLERWKEELKKKPDVEKKNKERIRNKIQFVARQKQSGVNENEMYDMDKNAALMKRYSEWASHSPDTLLSPARTLGSRSSPSANLTRKDQRSNGRTSLIQPNMAFAWTDREAAVEKEYDTENVRDTVGLMYKLMSQQAKEPPNGRYSHLIGRWMAW